MVDAQAFDRWKFAEELREGYERMKGSGLRARFEQPAVDGERFDKRVSQAAFCLHKEDVRVKLRKLIQEYVTVQQVFGPSSVERMTGLHHLGDHSRVDGRCNFHQCVQDIVVESRK